MRYKITLIVSVIAFLAVPFAAAAEQSEEKKIVNDAYPTLASSILKYAKLADLDDGVLLKSADLEITIDDLQEILSQQPQIYRRELEKNAFFLLEREAAEKLLVKAASKKLDAEDFTSERQFIEAFFNEITKDVEVSKKEIRQFYDQNKQIFENDAFSSVKGQIEPFVLQEKKQEYVDEYIANFGKVVDVYVDKSWTSQQSVKANDNPIGKARENGKPTLVIFTEKACCGTDQMKPIVDDLQDKYDDSINLLTIDTRQEHILTARYGARYVPTIVFYDRQGDEFYRNNGFYSKQQIIDKFSEMGIYN